MEKNCRKREAENGFCHLERSCHRCQRQSGLEETCQQPYSPRRDLENKSVKLVSVAKCRRYIYRKVISFKSKSKTNDFFNNCMMNKWNLCLRSIYWTFTDKNILIQYITNGILHACVTQWHFSFITLSKTKELDLLVRSVLSIRTCYNTDKWKDILHYDSDNNRILLQKMIWCWLMTLQCPVNSRFTQLILLDANQEKKHVACRPLDRMLFKGWFSLATESESES